MWYVVAVVVLVINVIGYEWWKERTKSVGKAREEG
jgi:hypothetical protein